MAHGLSLSESQFKFPHMNFLTLLSYHLAHHYENHYVTLFPRELQKRSNFVLKNIDPLQIYEFPHDHSEIGCQREHQDKVYQLF